jgi:hypothetical protein
MNDEIGINSKIGNSSIEKLFGFIDAPKLLVLSGTLLLTVGNRVVETIFQSNTVIVTGVMLITLGGSLAGFVYLRGNKPSEHNAKKEIDAKDVDKIVELLQETISENRKNKISLSNIDLSDEERTLVIDSLKNNIASSFSENIFKSIKNDLIDSKQTSNLESEYQESKDRLKDEISALTRRGNLNLIIGGSTTVIAVGILAYVVLTATPETLNTDNFLWHYIPRITVSIFIEVFSFFFLRLYRNSLEDIKYFQNELTNIEARYAALETALILGDKATLKDVIKSLSSIDRNSRLKKGETTISLEMLKAENQGLTNMLGSAKGIIDSFKNSDKPRSKE